MIKKRFFVVGRDKLVEKMISERGHQLQSEINEHTNAVVFTGGEDVSPFYYGEGKLPGTSCNLLRDMREVALFKSLPDDMVKIGICRGAQLLNVLCGGRMWQDVDNHCGTHIARVEFQPDPVKREKFKAEKKKDFIMVTSTHHQMMIPHSTGEVWLSARVATHKVSQNEVWQASKASPTDDFTDAEAVYYWMHSTLCFQPHPEYAGPVDCKRYFWECVDNIIPTEATDNAAA